MTRHMFLVLAVSAVLLSGCGGERMGVGQTTATQLVDLSAGRPAAAAGAGYLIGVGDNLDDSPVLGDDADVVDTSRLSVALREVVFALPGLSAFPYF